MEEACVMACHAANDRRGCLLAAPAADKSSGSTAKKDKKKCPFPAAATATTATTAAPKLCAPLLSSSKTFQRLRTVLGTTAPSHILAIDFCYYFFFLGFYRRYLHLRSRCWEEAEEEVLGWDEGGSAARSFRFSFRFLFFSFLPREVPSFFLPFFLLWQSGFVDEATRYGSLSSSSALWVFFCCFFFSFFFPAHFVCSRLQNNGRRCVRGRVGGPGHTR